MEIKAYGSDKLIYNPCHYINGNAEVKEDKNDIIAQQKIEAEKEILTLKQHIISYQKTLNGQFNYVPISLDAIIEHQQRLERAKKTLETMTDLYNQLFPQEQKVA